MANDLEDSILKQNVPGRWTTHGDRNDLRNEDNDDVCEVEEGAVPQTEDEALFEHAKYLNSADVPEPIRRGILNDRQMKSKTGVKGVLADYKAAVAMDKAQREATANYRQAVITRMTEGHKLSAEESVLLMQEKSQQKPKRDDDNLNEEDEESDEDEEFLDSFREKRLLAMMEKSNKPVFGDIKEVGSADFLEEIDNEDPRVVVVVHLYEPSVQSCTRMNRFLEEMARTMSDIKFLRMHASSNEIELDRMTLPILNIYKAGNSVTVLAGIAEELGEYFVKEDAVWLLESTLQANGLLMS
mmetsp:Transcript_25700/g.24564  ORF Transcript_25700/g.24564 Transcript_25700/m.24564 type:complete len:299 (+) Transcript_25700:147-1043(+)